VKKTYIVYNRQLVRMNQEVSQMSMKKMTRVKNRNCLYIIF